jgi:hypothetical protein
MPGLMEMSGGGGGGEVGRSETGSRSRARPPG